MEEKPSERYTLWVSLQEGRKHIGSFRQLMTDFLGRFQRLGAVLNLGLGSFALKLNRLVKPNYLMENWKLQSNKPIITLYFNCCPDWERVKRWDVLWGVDLLQMLLLWSIKVQGFSRLPFLDSLRTPHREFPDCRLFCLVVWSLSFWIGRVLYFIVSFLQLFGFDWLFWGPHVSLVHEIL